MTTRAGGSPRGPDGPVAAAHKAAMNARWPACPPPGFKVKTSSN